MRRLIVVGLVACVGGETDEVEPVRSWLPEGPTVLLDWGSGDVDLTLGGGPDGVLLVRRGLDQIALDLGDGSIEDLSELFNISLASDGSRVAGVMSGSEPAGAVWARGAAGTRVVVEQGIQGGVRSVLATPHGVAAETGRRVHVLVDGEIDEMNVGTTLVPQRFDLDVMVVQRGTEFVGIGAQRSTVEPAEPGWIDAQQWSGQWAVLYEDGLHLGPSGSEHAVPIGVQPRLTHMDDDRVVVHHDGDRLVAVSWDGTVDSLAGSFYPTVTPAHGGYYLGSSSAGLLWWNPGAAPVVQMEDPGGPYVVDAHGAMIEVATGGYHYVPVDGSAPTVFDEVEIAFLLSDDEWAMQRGTDESIVRWSYLEGERPVPVSGVLEGHVVASQTPVDTVALQSLDGQLQYEASLDYEDIVRLDDVLLVTEQRREGVKDSSRLIAVPWK